MPSPYSTRYERDRYDYDPRYERDRERSYAGGEDRGLIDRAGDEVRSWFGDENAERRRHRDEYEEERRRRQGGDWVNQPRSNTDVRANHVMTRRVTTVFPTDRIERAAQLMREFDCGSLPVVNNYGRLIGMVTDRDIAMRVVARGIDSRHAIVADCMTNETFACHANDHLDNCLRQMARHQVRRLPVVDDNDQIIGILSQADLARHADAWQGRGQQRRFADTVSEISEPSSKPYR